MKLETENQNQVRESIESLIASFCDHPSDLNVKLSPSRRNPIYTITCNLNDYGRIAGKMGAMITAIKVLVSTMSPDANPEVLLDEAACVGEKKLREQLPPLEKWDESDLDKLLHLNLPMVFGNPITIAYDAISTTATKVTIAVHNNYECSEQLAAALSVLIKAIGAKQRRLLRCEVL